MMDKNTLAGFGLLMLLLIGYILYNQQANLKQTGKLPNKDSVRQLTPTKLSAQTDSLLPINADSTQILPEQKFELRNSDIHLILTNKGAYPVQAELNHFKTHDGKPLMAFTGEGNSFDFSFRNREGRMLHTRDLHFTIKEPVRNQQLIFEHPECTLTYTLPDSGYMMQIEAFPNQLAQGETVKMDWQSKSLLTEHDLESQKMYTQVCYNLEKDGYDYHTIDEPLQEKWDQETKWISFKQHYFNTTLIPEPKTAMHAEFQAKPAFDTAKGTLSVFQTKMELQGTLPVRLRWFIGPNDYSLLKSYQLDMQEIIPLSYGIFGFVKYINTWLILPIFNGLSSLFSSYGVVILLLTIIIRLLMSPFTYKSYVSSAKMKALKPEMDELREKFGDDRQAFGMEQMKLYRQAGVNPLGGCLPALLQLPVFFALLSFFPHAIELRQEKFLWAKDLSTYDSILDLPFTIPFYGNHVSLFTLLFVITSLVLALYSMNMTMQDQSNPMMKYLPFIMPVMFLGIFNKLPAALTYYYTVSNIITLILQFVIQNYIIDPDKIHAQIQAKRNEPPKENKLMARMMEMQKQQQERMKTTQQRKK